MEVEIRMEVEVIRMVVGMIGMEVEVDGMAVVRMEVNHN